MFDIGFWEIAIISLIALIILGPERLPRAARSLGLWVGKARRMLAEVKRDIDRELDAADLKKIQELKDEVKDTVQDSKKMFQDAAIKQDLDEAKSALEETAATLNEQVTEKTESETASKTEMADSESAGTEADKAQPAEAKPAKSEKTAEAPKPRKSKKPQPVAKEPAAAEGSETVA